MLQKQMRHPFRKNLQAKLLSLIAYPNISPVKCALTNLQHKVHMIGRFLRMKLHLKTKSAKMSLVSNSHLQDRKSTRLNSSHVAISYAVFCLKKKKSNYDNRPREH